MTNFMRMQTFLVTKHGHIDSAKIIVKLTFIVFVYGGLFQSYIVIRILLFL